MSISSAFKTMASAGLLGLATLAAAPAAANPTATVIATERGHVIGDPEVETVLTEFVSYTCPHCAHFTQSGEGGLQMFFIEQGKIRLDIRPVIRNGVDITLSMLASCGGPERFRQNHMTLMHNQDRWMPKAVKSTAAQRARWASPDRAAGRRALASDLDLYRLMEQRGFTQTEVDRCLNDNAAAEALIANTRADGTEFGVNSTPSFALDGKLLEGVHEWNALSSVLLEKFEVSTATSLSNAAESPFGR